MRFGKCKSSLHGVLKVQAAFLTAGRWRIMAASARAEPKRRMTVGRVAAVCQRYSGLK
ncbi:hypothetical protein HMPREF9098_1751 [Kingella denitrificans ATCC 33394]|uniref:Uncharacterized protein n=1 Tax=Kingella denitrificans ATCC 33394 TaxID=888741 RepID=F0F0W6_9NEIS|nr:hypothetical protein HMPREF9098_1751 [Kingella denitrificans ATCC 33394]